MSKFIDELIKSNKTLTETNRVFKEQRQSLLNDNIKLMTENIKLKQENELLRKARCNRNFICRQGFSAPAIADMFIEAYNKIAEEKGREVESKILNPHLGKAIAHVIIDDPLNQGKESEEL